MSENTGWKLDVNDWFQKNKEAVANWYKAGPKEYVDTKKQAFDGWIKIKKDIAAEKTFDALVWGAKNIPYLNQSKFDDALLAQIAKYPNLKYNVAKTTWAVGTGVGLYTAYKFWPMVGKIRNIRFSSKSLPKLKKKSPTKVSHSTVDYSEKFSGFKPDFLQKFAKFNPLTHFKKMGANFTEKFKNFNPITKFKSLGADIVAKLKKFNPMDKFKELGSKLREFNPMAKLKEFGANIKNALKR
jgi:hypothetical protein